MGIFRSVVGTRSLTDEVVATVCEEMQPTVMAGVPRGCSVSRLVATISNERSAT